MSERLWGLALVSIGVLWMWDGWKLWQSERADSMFDSLGPDRYLILMGGLLALTGLIIGLTKPALSAAGASGSGERAERNPFFSPPVTFTLVLVGYALLIPILGYTGSTFIFFLVAYFLAGRRNMVATLVTSTISAAVFYLLFPYLADMTLPRGILGL